MDGVQWPKSQPLPNNYTPPFRPPQSNQPEVEEDSTDQQSDVFVPPVFAPHSEQKIEPQNLPEEKFAVPHSLEPEDVGQKITIEPVVDNFQSYVTQNQTEQEFNHLMGDHKTEPVVSVYKPEIEVLEDQNKNLLESQKTEIENNPPMPVANEEFASEKISFQGSRIEEIELSKVVANPYQPRRQFNQEALQELADSIAEHGVIQPLVVTETPNGFELVVGERRFRASVLAGLKTAPAIVKKQMQDQTKLEVALIENIQRQELNPIEEAVAYQKLLKDFGLSQDQLAQKVGKSRPAVANTVRLLNLPAELQRAIIDGKITEGHGRALLSLPDYDRQMQMYQTILDHGLNVRQVENRVREILNRKKTTDENLPDPKLVAIESDLRGKLGTQVKIQKMGRGGKILIEFFSDEDLEDIISKISKTENSGVNNSYLGI